MSFHTAYLQQRSVNMTRIDQVLALYGEAIERLEKASAALEHSDQDGARSHLVRAQLIVSGLASGLDLNQGELPVNLLRLYEFAAHCIAAGSRDQVEGALRVLRTVREGFEEIRPEAARLERSGAIPGAASVRLFEARG